MMYSAKMEGHNCYRFFSDESASATTEVQARAHEP